MNFRRWLLALGAFFALAVAVAGCGSNVPGNSVADVAGNPISLAAFNHWMYIAAKGEQASETGAPLVIPTDPPQFPSCISEIRKEVPTLAKEPVKELRATCKELFTSLSSNVLDFLIRAYWYQALAAREHVLVTNAAVMSAFNKDKQAQFGGSEAKFQSFLSSSGQTVQDVLYRVRANLVYDKLINKMAKPVTSQTIAAFYAAHSSEFVTPESRDLRIVLAKTKSSADAAKSALSHGQSWTTVAKKYSIDSATKDKGGQLNDITQNGQQDQTLTNAAFSAPQNKLEGPIQSPFGYYVLEVTKINKSTRESLAKAHNQISTALTNEAKAAAQNKVNALAKKRYYGQTFCRTGYVMDDCSGYKPPKKSSTTGTGTTGTTG